MAYWVYVWRKSIKEELKHYLHQSKPFHPNRIALHMHKKVFVSSLNVIGTEN